MFTKTQYTIILTLMYMLGITAFFKHLEILLSIIILIVTISLLLKKKITNFLALSMVLIFACGSTYADFKMKEHDLLELLTPTSVTLIGQVTSIPPTIHPDRTKFFVTVKKVYYVEGEFEPNSKTYVTIVDKRENYKKIKIGDEIKLYARLRAPQSATNPAQFNYKNYLKNFNTFTTAYVTQNGWEIIGSPKSKKWIFIQNLNILRQKIIEKHSKIIKSPNIEILGGIVFGDDAISPPEDIRQTFIQSGLMHILAASGLNVALIFGIWVFIYSRLKIPYRLGTVIGIILIIFYTFMTGLGPPVLRASMMLTFALIGKLIDRNTDNVALLLFVASLILIYNPAFLFDVGFQLSFTVTLGLLTFCPIIAQKTKHIPQIIAGSVYVPLIAQAIVSPIQMFYFNNIAIYSLFANILSMPFVSAVSFLGFVSSILAIIPKLPQQIISAFDYIMNPLISCLVGISSFFANLPNALLTTTQCSVFQISLYYTLAFMLFLILKKGWNKKRFISLFAVFIVLLFTAIPLKNRNLETIFFNIGNADSALVKTPNNKYVIIDTGRRPYEGGYSHAKAIIYEYLKDNGIKEIEYLIVTHYDDDHAGGAIDLLNLVKVKNIVLNPIYDENKLYKEIPNFARQKGVNIIYPKNNETLLSYPNGEMRIFQKQAKKISSNNSSLVTTFTQNSKTILFTGDAEINIVKDFNLPSSIDVLKVGHHGAEKTVTKEFLEDKNVQVAVVSTGLNPYGHPSPDTMNILQSSSTQLLRTDVDHAIKIVIKNNDLKVYVFKNKKWINTK